MGHKIDIIDDTNLKDLLASVNDYHKYKLVIKV